MTLQHANCPDMHASKKNNLQMHQATAIWTRRHIVTGMLLAIGTSQKHMPLLQVNTRIGVKETYSILSAL